MSSPQSPGPSPEDDAENEFGSQQWNNEESTLADSKTVSPSETPMSGQAQKSLLPLQKRRRVTRACDECRRKKIKCDGKQPCTHCTVYSYECTYDQPSNRRRNPGPQYIEALENRLHKSEAILRSALPGIDLDDPKYDARGIEQIIETSQTKKSLETTESGQKSEDDARIQTMIGRTGSLDLDDQGYWDFHGQSSGFAFMRKMKSQFGENFDSNYQLPAATKLRPVNQVLESPKSNSSSPYEFRIPPSFDLPTREVAIELCRNTLDDCCALMRFVHRPTFFRKLHRIYTTDQEHYDSNDIRFVPQLYIVLGIGCLFAKTEEEATLLDVGGYKEAIEEGYQYFNAGRQLIDITDCRDLSTLQTVVFMIIFLQSTAKLATCYAYLGIALRACCRLGLHRNIESAKFNTIEREERRRLFWLIRKLDCYVGTMLGLPQMLSEEDIDQQFPTEVPDECIFEDGIRTSPNDPFPLIKATNAHARLTMILRKVVRYIYPVKDFGVADGSPDQRYSISHAKIREIERDLQKWMDELPMQLRPSENAGDETSRVQQLLRMSYAHVQMMLYRPFIHYVSMGSEKQNIDKRSYACAAACVSVARNIVHITTEMKRRGLLIGSYWFVMYTTYFGILSLVFFVLGNPESPTAVDILKDAMEGKDTLASLAKRSLAADRCTHSLANLFEELPEKLQERRTSLKASGNVAVASRKRSQPSDDHVATKVITSVPDVKTPRTSDDFSSSSQASTFPHGLRGGGSKRKSIPNPLMNPAYNISDQQLNSQPSHPGLVGYGTPSSTTSGSTHVQFEHQLEDRDIPDLKAIMFPSDNPFTYPNQPMSTLEGMQYMSPEGQQDSFTGVMTENDAFCLPNNIGNPPLGQDLSMADLRIPSFGNNVPQFQSNRDFSTPMTGHLNYGIPQMEDAGVMGSLPVSQDDYWDHVSKSGVRTGMTPGGVNLDDLFGGEGWSSVWPSEHTFSRP